MLSLACTFSPGCSPRGRGAQRWGPSWGRVRRPRPWAPSRRLGAHNAVSRRLAGRPGWICAWRAGTACAFGNCGARPRGQRLGSLAPLVSCCLPTAPSLRVCMSKPAAVAASGVRGGLGLEMHRERGYLGHPLPAGVQRTKGDIKQTGRGASGTTRSQSSTVCAHHFSG